MKTLSRTFAFILLAIIAIITFVSCLSKFATNYKYDQPIGDPNPNHPVYRTFKKGDDNEHDFRLALIRLKKNQGDCEIKFLHTGPHHTPEPHHYKDICEHGGTVNLKTDRVIKSKTAYNTVGQPAANDPNVTWHVLSNYQSDIDAVMQTLNQ
jgi:ABC-type nickel/cobalt efflux system permease component RcnA